MKNQLNLTANIGKLGRSADLKMNTQNEHNNGLTS